MNWKNLVAAAGFATAGAVGVTYIDADGGGNVLGYVQHYESLQRQGIPVVIRGVCNSSCTMALGYSNVCLMPDAELGFHPAYTPILFGWFSYVLNPAANEVMLSHYPADAKAVINKHGDLSKDPGGWRYPRLFYVKATEFPSHYLCHD